MKKLTFGLLVATTILSSNAIAQPTYQWYAQMDQTGSAYFLDRVRAYDMDVDGSGNVYVVGSVQGTVDFDVFGPGGSVTSSNNVPGTSTSEDPFIVKYDANGNFQWVNLISNVTGYGDGANDRAVSVAVDQSGNAYVTGDMYDGSLGGFLARFDAAGTNTYTYEIEGYSGFKTQENVCVDNAGNVYVFDRFDGTEDLDPTAGVDMHTAVGAYDAYIAKFTGATGTFQWAQQIGNANYIDCHDIETDGTYLYVTGGFQGTMDFDPGPGTANVTGDGTNYDCFVARYLASTGAYDYADAIGSSGSHDYGRDLELDGNNMFLVVQFTDNVDFDFGAGTTNLDTGDPGVIEMAIARYDKNTLALSWAYTTGYNGGGTTNMCIFDNGPLMIGNFSGTKDFDPGAGTFNLTATGGTNFVTSLLDASGNFQWAEKTAVNTSVAYWNSIASTGSSEFYTSGDFSSDVALDPSTTAITASEGTQGDDGYVAKYSTCTPSTAPTGITAASNPICPGGNTDLTVQGGSLGTGADWYWYTGSCGGTAVGTGTTINVSPSSTTTYYVRAEGTCGTTACAQVTVTVDSESTAATSISAANTNICSGDMVGLSVSGGSLGTGADWQWYTGSCGGTAAGSGTSINVSPSTTTTYYVRAEGTCNTTACVQVTINVTTTPTPSITSSNADICEGTDLALTGTPAGGSWNVVSGPGSLAGSTLTATGSGVINIEYTVTSGSCSGSDNQNITALAASDASWTSPGTVCESGGTIDLNTLITGDAGGTWSGTAVSGSTFDPSGQNGNTITITYDVGTTCPDSEQHDITVEAAVTATWTQPSAICESAAALDLDALVTGSTGGSWSGSGVSGSTFDPTGLSGMISVTYSVGSGSCSDMLTQDIEVLSAPATPTFSANDSTVCAGETVTLSGSGSGTVDYNVYSDNGGSNLIGTAPLDVNPATTTTYYLEAEATNGCGNIGGLQPLTINVNPTPTLTVSADQNICLGQSVTLQATGSGTLSWSTSETTSSIDVSPTTTTTYTVSIVDGNNCSAEDSITVNVQQSASVSAVDDIASTQIDQLVNINVADNDVGDENTISIIDNPTNGVASVQSDNTIDYLPLSGFVGNDSITYSICDVFCSSICDTATVRIAVEMDDEFTVPGGFSPNGDGINDIFVIEGLDDYPDNSLTIFNRWGDIVFVSAPYNNDWSGQAEGARTITGDEVVSGTYFYILKLDDTTELHGSIEIKK